MYNLVMVGRLVFKWEFLAGGTTKFLPGYQGLKSLDRFRGNENSMLTHPLRLLEQKISGLQV